MYNVLLVDDEYMILEGLKHIIDWEKLGFKIVKTTRWGDEAFDFIKDEKVDVLLTDVSMPKMTGIELVKKVRDLSPNLPVLMLSGYQEFEYVKQGIELGIKGYLLKPIDKEELETKIREIKMEIEENKKQNHQKKLLIASYTHQWLNDELNEDDFNHLLKLTNKTISGNYAVIIVNVKGKNELLIDYLKKIKQPFFLKFQADDKQQIVIIYQDAQVELKHFLKSLEKEISSEDYSIALGESVKDWFDVYESYEKAKKLLEFQSFYGTDDILHTINVTHLDDKVGLQLLSFNKSLTIGDIKTIKEELNNVYQKITMYRYAPESVRYVTFLLFTDIYRYFPSLDAKKYNDTLLKIHSSGSVSELKHLLIHLLDTLDNTPRDAKRYSSLVKKTIEIIAVKYREDLSLKLVAEILHVNSVYLGQLFKKETERSFSQYLNQMRIKKAQVELLNTDKSINEIGYDIGYNNPNYFFKIFRKLNGITPKEFREKYIHNYHEL